jgi:4-carboxymuconolactone decarboxylase
MDELYEQGLKVRRDVLGNEHVERSLKNVDDFSEEIQQLVTEYCWGKIWTREGLSRQQRSLINIAMLTALNRKHELKVHVRGALNNGCTEREIKEVLMQTAIYCGVPAALESFRNASEVIKEFHRS